MRSRRGRVESIVEIIEDRVGERGNFISIFFAIKGKNAFGWLKNEAGVHRVQRVPETENKGRVQTSTASVVVFPPFQDIEIGFSPKNLKIETCRASGAGGQHVNTTDSAVKATYTYTNNAGKTEIITAISQESRKQHENKKKARFFIPLAWLTLLAGKIDGDINHEKASCKLDLTSAPDVL